MKIDLWITYPSPHTPPLHQLGRYLPLLHFQRDYQLYKSLLKKNNSLFAREKLYSGPKKAHSSSIVIKTNVRLKEEQVEPHPLMYS